jgi:hypothetical protein
MGERRLEFPQDASVLSRRIDPIIDARDFLHPDVTLLVGDL